MRYDYVVSIFIMAQKGYGDPHSLSWNFLNYEEEEEEEEQSLKPALRQPWV